MKVKKIRIYVDVKKLKICVIGGTKILVMFVTGIGSVFQLLPFGLYALRGTQEVSNTLLKSIEDSPLALSLADPRTGIFVLVTAIAVPACLNLLVFVSPVESLFNSDGICSFVKKELPAFSTIFEKTKKLRSDIKGFRNRRQVFFINNEANFHEKTILILRSFGVTIGLVINAAIMPVMLYALFNVADNVLQAIDEFEYLSKDFAYPCMIFGYSIPIMANGLLLPKIIDIFYNLVDKIYNALLSKVSRLRLYNLFKLAEKYLSRIAHSKGSEENFFKFHKLILKAQRTCYSGNDEEQTIQRLQNHVSIMYDFLKQELNNDDKKIDTMLEKNLVNGCEDIIKFMCGSLGTLAGVFSPLADAFSAVNFIKKLLNSHSNEWSLEEILFGGSFGIATFIVNALICGWFGKSMGEKSGIALTELIKSCLGDCTDFKSSKYSYWNTFSLVDWLKWGPIIISTLVFTLTKFSMGDDNAPLGLPKNISGGLSIIGPLVFGSFVVSGGIDAITGMINGLLFKSYINPANIDDIDKILEFSSWWKFRCIRAAVKFDLSIYESLEKSLASIPDDELRRVHIGKDFIFEENQVDIVCDPQEKNPYKKTHFFNHAINVVNDDKSKKSDYCGKEVMVCV